jgi:hypothetical protein
MANTDSEIRKAEHLAGKQHKGWEAIREHLTMLKVNTSCILHVLYLCTSRILHIIYIYIYIYIYIVCVCLVCVYVCVCVCVHTTLRMVRCSRMASQAPVLLYVTHICVYIPIHTHTHTHTHTYTHTHKNTPHIHTHIHTDKQTYIHAYIRIYFLPCDHMARTECVD